MELEKQIAHEHECNDPCNVIGRDTPPREWHVGMGEPSLSIPEPPPCPCCGAKPGTDHVNECSYLRGIRAQEFPILIDDNGLPHHMNLLAAAQDRAGKSETLSADKDALIRQLVDQMKRGQAAVRSYNCILDYSGRCDYAAALEAARKAGYP